MMNQIKFNCDLIEIKKKLQYYAMSLTTAADKADDLVQDTLLKALLYRENFREDTNFNAWVYTIMKNTFINEYRRNIKTRKIFGDSNNDFLLKLSSDEGPDSSYSAGEIQNTIEGLKDEFRIPFNLFLEGYRYKEIAERLALPLGTVKSRIFFTRKKLVSLLSGYSKAQKDEFQ